MRPFAKVLSSSTPATTTSVFYRSEQIERSLNPVVPRERVWSVRGAAALRGTVIENSTNEGDGEPVRGKAAVAPSEEPMGEFPGSSVRTRGRSALPSEPFTRY
jgi:hypothetical protein